MSRSAARTVVPDTGVSVRVHLGNGQRFSVDELWNISLGGVFLEMAEPLSFGQDLNVEFVLSPSRTIRCSGFVVWSTKTSPQNGHGRSGIGLRLTEIGIAQMRELSEAVGRSLS